MNTPSERSTELPQKLFELDPQNWLENHGDRLYNYALSRLGRHELAEEVVQETLLAAVHSMHHFQGKSTEQTWLFGILKNKICDFIRNEWKSKSVLRLEDEVNPARGLFSEAGRWQGNLFLQDKCALESNELWQIIQLCLRKLPNNQARVFVLRVLEEKNSEEICNELEISTTNFRARLHRARLGLARCVSENWPQ